MARSAVSSITLDTGICRHISQAFPVAGGHPAYRIMLGSRETYIGRWPPDPVPEPDDDLRADNLTLTLMLALERLSPLECPAFLHR